MRLKALELYGFRGFAQSVQLDLDADAVIFVGVNGSGKTSLFDAVMWALCGSLPRVQDPGGSVISEYAASGEARVALEVDIGSNKTLGIVRSQIRGDDATQVQIDIDGQRLRGAEAQVGLYRTLWPDALSAPDGGTALLTALTRSVYLQQDLVREFVEANSDSDRFEAVSELVGVGRARELQVALDKSRRAWSQATNKLAAEADPTEKRLQELDAQLARLSTDDAATPKLEADWDAWWRRAIGVLGDTISTPMTDASNAATQLDDALKLLATEGRRDDRRLAEAKTAQAELLAERKDVKNEPAAALSGALEDARAAVVSATAALEGARQLQAQLREQAIRSQETAAQLATLAQLALQHLSDRCPVCTQAYDHATTVAHLNALIDGQGAKQEKSADMPDIDALSAETVERERHLREIEAEYERRRAHEQVQEVANAQRAQRLAALGIPNEPDANQELAHLTASIEQRQRSISLLREQGETLALALARSSEIVRRADLVRQRAVLARSVASGAGEVAARRETSKLADQIFDALRDAAAGLVDSQLEQIKPLVERIYARIDPHPAFRKVELSSRFESSRGRLRVTVSDPLENVSVDRPATVLSSSQLNALAVSVFLALNLGVPQPPLDAVLLDDPLQSLDDVNLLGLVDLLRRTKQRRQLVISTHDMRFAALLERKLRPSASTRTIVVELSGWRRERPQVEQRDVPPESEQLRLVA